MATAQQIADSKALAGGHPISVSVTLRGGLFAGGIPKKVELALKQEVLAKVNERINRPYRGKRLGRRNNTVTGKPLGLQVTETSTLIWPRTKGVTWQRKNIAIVRSMAPRVLNAAAKRIAAEMGGA